MSVRKQNKFFVKAKLSRFVSRRISCHHVVITYSQVHRLLTPTASTRFRSSCPVIRRKERS